jgi:NAD/NADP transhydrogenase beta subunit
VPKSRVRKKKSEIYTPPPQANPKKKRSPRWVGPMVLFLLIFGVAWLVVSYVTGANLPVFDSLGNWNVLVGFAFIASGFALATQWR